jgi:Tat protein secretion system quality control protein TatD with DNase activity
MNHIYISIPASISYDEQLKAAAKEMPEDRLFCETDSPCLWKHERNTPLNVLKGYKAVSKAKSISLKTLEKTIEISFKNLFLKR